MEELAYIEAIISEAQKKGNVYQVALEIGELSTIDPRVLQKGISQKTQWTVLTFEGEGKVGCMCGFVGRPKVIRKNEFGVDFTCPKCNMQPAILEGDKVVMKDVKVR